VTSFDGRRIGYRDSGGPGRPTILLHGIMSDGAWSWFGPGHVARLVALGRRAIVPDLRGHGSSDAPHDVAAYADDAIAHDVETLLTHLAIAEYDLVGYSMGARTAIRLMVRGARPGRAVLGGAGDALIFGSPLLRSERFDRLIATEGRSGVAGDAETWQWTRHAGFDLRAMRALVAAIVPTSETDLGAIEIPSLVVMGDADQTVGSGERLSQLLPRASFRSVPGDHVQAGLSAEFGQELAEFLRA